MKTNINVDDEIIIIKTKSEDNYFTKNGISGYWCETKMMYLKAIVLNITGDSYTVKLKSKTEEKIVKIKASDILDKKSGITSKMLGIWI